MLQRISHNVLHNGMYADLLFTTYREGLLWVGNGNNLGTRSFLAAGADA